MIYLYISPTNQILNWNWNDFLNYDTPVLDFWVDNSTNGYRFDLLCQKRLTILEVSKELEWKFLMQRQLLLMLAEFCYTHIGPRFFFTSATKKTTKSTHVAMTFTTFLPRAPRTQPGTMTSKNSWRFIQFLKDIPKSGHCKAE